MNKIVEDEIEVLYDQLKDTRHNVADILDETGNMRTLLVHYFSNPEIKDKVNVVIQIYEDGEILQVNCRVEIDGDHCYPEVYKLDAREINQGKVRELFNRARSYIDTL